MTHVTCMNSSGVLYFRYLIPPGAENENCLNESSGTLFEWSCIWGFTHCISMSDFLISISSSF